MGEGWHNNHHHYQSCARQGFKWWEIDVSYYIIRLLGAVGLVWDIREPTEKALQASNLGRISRRRCRRSCNATEPGLRAGSVLRHARISFTTVPATSVSRKSRPL